MKKFAHIHLYPPEDFKGKITTTVSLLKLFQNAFYVYIYPYAKKFTG